MLFLLRKLIGMLLAPSMWGFGAVIVGVVLMAFRRTRRAGLWTMSAGGLWLVLLSFGLPFDPIGVRLEGRHTSLLDAAQHPVAAQAEWVVVLGGGHRAEPWLPPSAYLREAATYRLIEGVRIHRQLTASGMLFTGFGGARQMSSAEAGAAVAMSIGVDSARVVLEAAPRTTGEEALAVQQRVGDDPVVLVTSATHMARAVVLFEQAGVRVVPAPAGQQVVPRRGSRDWRPLGERIVYADAVAHELFGMLAARMGL